MYAASVNPPRRAKLQAAASLLPALLPSPPGSASPPPSFQVTNVSSSSDSVQPRKKRGRKPASGASSRAAREAARKANHSRIEKARRGKINNALQELKMLVPADFAPAMEGEEDDVDNEDTPGTSGLEISTRESGKKAPSEREFKLDILERTVLFVRALLQRVDDNGLSGTSEAEKQDPDGCQCPCHCGLDNRAPRKRKSTEQEDREKDEKKRRTGFLTEKEQVHLSDIEDDAAEVKSSTESDDDDETIDDSEAVTSPRSHANVETNVVRLPSISELLSSPDTLVPAQLAITQLPSPSLSPYFFSHHHQDEQSSRALTGRGKASYLSPSLSPSVPRRPSISRLSVSEREEQPSEGRQGPASDRVSCPVGMSYLLTPPSANAVSRRSVSSPDFCLPSSVLDERCGIPEDTSTNEVEPETDAEDGGARTATLALLQMHRTSYSRAANEECASSSTPTPRLTLTPGGLLGIRTGVHS